jgi:Golgi phosphoprotein 3
MGEDRRLLLHEEILLLALRDREGTFAPGTMYPYALGGAILAELFLRGRIRLVEHRQTRLVDTYKPKPVGDYLVDKCLSWILTAKQRASLDTWVARIARSKDLTPRLARQLCHRGILRMDEKKVLLLFTRKIYPEIDPRPERQLIARLREAIFADSPHLDHRTVILLALAHRSGILQVLFDRRALKSREKRIEQITNGDVLGAATQEAIQATQATEAALIAASLMMAST